MGVNMLLTIGGILLLSTFVLYANGLMSDNVKVAGDNEYMITAISLAQSLIDEAKSKAFDEKAIAGSITSTDSLTNPESFGRDGAGEFVILPDTVRNDLVTSFARFDDIDDYDGYIRIVNTPRAEGYQVRAAVTYASETSPDSSKSTKTFCKRLTVTVTSPYFPPQHAVRLSYAFIY